MGLGGHTEVYDAEMAALSIGATQAAEYITDHPNITHITFFADNAAAVLAIADPRPQAAQIFTTNFHNTIRHVLETHNARTIKIAWCPSHCRIKGNDRADTLAKEATQRERQTPYSVSCSNALRCSKNTILKLWQIDWRNLPKEGNFAIANRFPPSLKPTPHFLQLQHDHELFGRLTQCRTGHAYTGEFRRRFLPHLGESNTCPCDNTMLQTREHIL